VSFLHEDLFNANELTGRVLLEQRELTQALPDHLKDALCQHRIALFVQKVERAIENVERILGLVVEVQV